jgi:hypothetical protein
VDSLRISRLIAGAAALLVLAPAATAAVQRTAVTAPKSGAYDGATSQHRKISLEVSGRNVSLLVFRFSCGRARGTGSLQDIRLKKGRSGYRFRIFAYSSVQYGDQSSENAPVRIRGLFTRNGGRARGRARVTTDRCGVTRFRWWVKRTPVEYPLPTA